MRFCKSVIYYIMTKASFDNKMDFSFFHSIGYEIMSRVPIKDHFPGFFQRLSGWYDRQGAALYTNMFLSLEV